MKLELELVELFDQPVEAVWRAITDPRILARWLMENDFEPTVGHAFTLRDTPTSFWRGVIECKVIELAPPRRMVWSWYSGIEGEHETRVIFELSAEGAVTRFVLRHEGEANAPRTEALRHGWSRRMPLLRAELTS